jgi:hypothetical protein
MQAQNFKLFYAVEVLTDFRSKICVVVNSISTLNHDYWRSASLGIQPLESYGLKAMGTLQEEIQTLAFGADVAIDILRCRRLL